MKNWIKLSMLVFAISAQALATGFLTMKVKVYSMTDDQYVLQTKENLYYVKRAALDQEQQKKLSFASTNEVTLNIPVDAIREIKSAKAGH